MAEGRQPRSSWLIPQMIMASILMGGCAEEEPRVYIAPRDATQATSSASNVGLDHPADASRGMTWRVPDGWRTIPGNRPMRIATLQAGEGDLSLEVVISAFPGTVGGRVANLNRWREQFGLPPIDETGFDRLTTPFQHGTASGWTLRIVPEEHEPATAMLGAIIEGDPQQTWFIRASGRPDLLDRHEPRFLELAHSFRRAESIAPPQGHAHHDHSPAAPAAPELTWRVPADWQPASTTSAIVYASFHVGDDAERAVVTVTPLRGDGGGLLANINMWRGQLALPMVESLDEQSIDTLHLPAGPATILELHGPAQTERGPLGVLVAIIPQGERTWFFRMTGPPSTLHPQRAAFLAFVESVQFLK